MKKKQKTIILILIVLILAALYAACSIIANLDIQTKEEDKKQSEEIKKEEEPVKEEGPDYSNLIALWNNNEAINSDYVGELSFDSGLLDYPFVCPNKNYREYRFFTNSGHYVEDYDHGCESGSCSGNDVYLRMDWKTMGYELGGSVFMDYRNTINDENIIIYGHHYYKNLDKDRVLFFTPLEKLLKEENYEDNKYLQIVLENEIRRYEVAYVYKFHVSKDYSDYEDLQYYRTDYNHKYNGDEDEGYYEKYIQAMEKAQLYDTGVTLTTSDKTLTLQTCLEETTNAVQVVVCKEIERISIS